MSKRSWYGLAVGLLIIIALAVVITQNTTLLISSSSLENGEATFESDFPNATCRKVLRFGFPPVKLECQEKSSE